MIKRLATALEFECGNRCAKGINPCNAREVLDEYNGPSKAGSEMKNPFDRVDPIEGLLAFIGKESLDQISEMRTELLKNRIMPTKLLIPRAKLLGCDLEFADVAEPKMIGEFE